MTIDTAVRHVTKPGATIFLELGFEAAEAKRLHAASRKQINVSRQLKEQLMQQLSSWIVEILGRVGKPVRLAVGG